MQASRIETFLSKTYSSKQKFSKEFKKLIKGRVNPKHLYLRIISELEEAISKDDFSSFKRFGKLIDQFGGVEPTATLKTYFNDSENTLKTTNLAILACKHNRIEILRYVLSNTKVFENLFIDKIAPKDKDESTHDAFYYAVRSQNVDLVDTLIKNWPGNYFTNHSAVLDEILSRAYEECKLKNIALSDEMEMFIERKIIDLRFFSNRSGQCGNTKNNLGNIIGRIKLLIDKITTLQNVYSNNQKKIDATFLFIGRFIAQNIFVLKHQLKSTYNRLPWEEMEFCLVVFLSSYAEPREINLFYRSVLNKDKIILFLKNFANKLTSEIPNINRLNVDKLAKFPNLSRNEVVLDITSNCAQFVDLYADHEKIRDIYALEKISAYLNLALKANPAQKTDQIIINRTLQVIGECMQNTLESPNLCNETSELLLLSLSKNTRCVVTDLRNSLSHADSLVKRTEIQEITDEKFFKGLQNDIKRIDDVVTDIRLKNKIKTIAATRDLLIGNGSIEEKIEVSEILSSIEIDEMKFFEWDRFNMLELEKLENLVKQMSAILTPKTFDNKEYFDEINSIVSSAKTKSQNIKFDYKKAFVSLQSLAEAYTDLKLHHSTAESEKLIKIFSTEVITFLPTKESDNLNKVAQLSKKIVHEASITQLDEDLIDSIKELDLEISHIIEFAVEDIKWIEKLGGRLSKKGVVAELLNKKYDLTNDKCDKLLAQKLTELENVLNTHFSGAAIKKLSSFKKDKKLLAVVEMLILDIMSLLSRSNNKYLEDNSLFVDDYCPLLMGKCLRNHIAHGNMVLDLLLFDPLVALMLNAEKLVSENMVQNKKKVGKFVPDNPAKVKQIYDHNLRLITSQEDMFAALMDEDLEKLKNCLLKGADIRGRTINSSTVLHIAAQGSNLDLVKFIVNQNIPDNVRDSNGQTALTIAASYGRKNIVEFFLSRSSISVDHTDKYGRTSLHWAAKNGHEDVVQLLLAYNARKDIQDNFYFAPVHWAIHRKHVSSAKMLLNKETNMDTNQALNGFTSLHLAARSGCLELIEFLIEEGANVHMKCDFFGTALHLAAFGGHLEIVAALIREGSNVNGKLIDGSTPLHVAVSLGHEKIAELLLKNGANVDDACRINGNTALHLAAEDGYDSIIELLMKNMKQNNIDIQSKKGITPLYMAVKDGHLKAVEKLIEHHADINFLNNHHITALHCAVDKNWNDIADLLIRNDANVNLKHSTGGTPLIISAFNGNQHLVEVLIKNKANVSDQNDKGFTATHTAAQGGHRRIVEVLLKNGGKINSETGTGMTPLHLAACKGHYKVVEYLLKCGADINIINSSTGATPLYLAASHGFENVVELLIKQGANMDMQVKINSKTESVMHAAVKGGYSKIVEILLKKGAKVNFTDPNVPPLVMVAALTNNKTIVDLLIKKGADINGDKGQPLMVSVRHGYQDLVEFLLQKGAKVDIKSSSQCTLLHHAAERGHCNIANLLISKMDKADIDAVDNENNAPLDYAAGEGHLEIVELLISKGAQIQFDSTEELCRPLMKAIINGHINVVNILLPHLKLNQTLEKKFWHQAFMASVIYGHLPIVEKLMREGNIDLNDKGINVDNQTYLHLAVKKGNLEIVKYLVDNGSDIQAKATNGLKPIEVAVQENFKEAVQYFRSLGMDIDEAVPNNPSDMARSLIDTEFHHEAQIKSVLDIVDAFMAQEDKLDDRDHEEKLRTTQEEFKRNKENLGIYHEDTLNSMNMLAYLLFRLKKKQEAIKILEEASSIQKEVFPPDHLYHFTTNINIAAILMSLNKSISALKLCKRYYVQAETTFGSDHLLIKSTAHLIKEIELHLGFQDSTESELWHCIQTDLNKAVIKGDIKTINRLLTKGADVNETDIEGRAPIHYAVERGFLDIINLLLENAADLTLTTNKGNTLLHTAAIKNNSKAAQILLDHGARKYRYKLHDFVNAQTIRGGMTALHVAAEKGYVEVSKILLKHYADPDMLNKDGKTPLELASDQKIVELFAKEPWCEATTFGLAPEDFSGVRLFLNQLFLKSDLDLNELTNYIIHEQPDIGLVIKEIKRDEPSGSSDNANENEDVKLLGCATAICLSHNEELKFVSQLKDLFLDLSKQHATEKTNEFFVSLFNEPSNSVGFLVNERYSNLPPSIAVLSLGRLKDELDKKSSQDATYKFTHFIIMCKLNKIPTKKKKQNVEDYDIIWGNTEDEIIDKEAEARFEYGVVNESDSALEGSETEDDIELLPFRRVLVFAAHKFDLILKRLINKITK